MNKIDQATKAIPVSAIDFYSDASISDPYPVYEELRALGPVVYLEKHDLYALPNYREVSEVLRQPLRYSNARGVSPLQKVNDILIGSTLNSDPPAHDRTRAITSEPLLPGALKEVEGRIQNAADGLVDTLCQRREFDAIADFARFLPVTIVAELVGLPPVVDSAQMLKWASATFNLFGADNARTKEAFEDLKDLRDFLIEYGRGCACGDCDVQPRAGGINAVCVMQHLVAQMHPNWHCGIAPDGIVQSDLGRCGQFETCNAAAQRPHQALHLKSGQMHTHAHMHPLTKADMIMHVARDVKTRGVGVFVRVTVGRREHHQHTAALGQQMTRQFAVFGDIAGPSAHGRCDAHGFFDGIGN